MEGVLKGLKVCTWSWNENNEFDYNLGYNQKFKANSPLNPVLTVAAGASTAYS